jgi:hypothetical protein
MENKLKKAVKSTILCIRFPFLYPRNRFTGNHYDNWKIVEFHRKWWKLTGDSFLLKIVKEKESLISYGNINDHIYTLRVKGEYFQVCNEHGRPWISIPISNYGKGSIVKCGWRKTEKSFEPVLIVGEDWEDAENVNHFIEVVHAKWLRRWIRFLDWINDWPLQLLHCIPTYTELGAMDKGWRKAFGIQICKEIRSALLKHGWKVLFKYRIMQIKEKWGELCWYDSYTPKEVFDVIRKYESISRHTCIDCGAPATKMSTGWICPYCDNCIGDREYTEIK